MLVVGPGYNVSIPALVAVLVVLTPSFCHQGLRFPDVLLMENLVHMALLSLRDLFDKLQ